MEKPAGFVDIKGYEKLYAVSRNGEIYKYPLIKKRCTKRFKNGCLLNPTPHRKGYLTIVLRDYNSSPKGFLVHRLVAQAFIPNPKNLDQINHKDMNKANNHISNLEWCSASENMCFRRTPKRKNKTSKYKGVSVILYIKKSGTISKYIKSSIRKSGKSHLIGIFNSEEEAAIAYNEKAKQIHGEFSYLNEL